MSSSWVKKNLYVWHLSVYSLQELLSSLGLLSKSDGTLTELLEQQVPIFLKVFGGDFGKSSSICNSLLQIFEKVSDV